MVLGWEKVLPQKDGWIMQLSSGKTIWSKPEMKSKIKLKICIDILMTAALLFLMPYELVGRAAHEWIGTEIFLLFILHHILNRKWTAHMFKGKYAKFRILQTILVAAIFISMIGSMVSGILLSEYVFAAIKIKGVANMARNIHPDVSASGTTLEQVSQDA
jgi:hypothetical protein